VKLDGTRTKWHGGQESLDQWHRGALEPFDGVIANVFNGIQVKYLKSSPIMRIRWLIRLIFLLDF
jgi:hypothetical protein